MRKDILLGLYCVALAAGVLVSPAAAVAAAQTPVSFPFVIPWDDAKHGVATDVSFLNLDIEPIVARGGHFYDAHGRRVRFLAVSFAGVSCFPSHADAEKVAARIAKYGINLVRLHHMDNTWDSKGSLWDMTASDHRHISATQLDRLDYLVYQFEKHGVYVDINLHVSRQFSAADGFPTSVEQIPFDFDKRVDQFDTTMIALQKEYARQLLTHVNPYTNRAYTADPGVALIEINNENSLTGNIWEGMGRGLDRLPEPFLGELGELWNAWLARQYSSTDALRSGWGAGATPVGPSLVTPASEWVLELHGTQGTLAPVAGADQTARDITVNVAAADGTEWHTQAEIDGLTFQEGAEYTVNFRAKADAARQIGVYTSIDQADWHGVGLSTGLPLTTDWQNYHYVFTAHDVVPGHCRVSFLLGKQTGTLWIAGLTVSPGDPGAGLQAGQTIEAANIPMLAGDGGTPRQRLDWITFLADTEQSYAGEMRTYVKGTLGARACITESQMGYGGMTSVRRELGSDYCDNHAYWQHPSFPHRAWDSEDWNVGNTSMVSDLANGGSGTLGDLAKYRVDGKPYTISEYNHPAPSDFQAEAVPVLTSFAAAQDWDAIFLFDYGSYGAGVANDQIDGFFGVAANPSKWAFLPAAAVLLREGLLDPLPGLATMTLPVTGPNRAAYTQLNQVWTTPPDMFAQRLALVPDTSPLRSTPHFTVSNTSTSPAGTRLSLQKLGGDAVYTAAGPRGQVIAGFAGGHNLTLGPVTYTFPASGNNYMALMLAPMDARTLTTSRHLLLTVVGRVENQGMVWNAGRTSVGSHWGHGPVEAEAVPATISLATNGPRTVYALDPTGSVHSTVPSTYSSGILTFTVGDQQTLWYAIVAPSTHECIRGLPG
ncbi:MAG: hypothetical protein ACLQVD_12965 [Capsulimonadaceae bacterium]